MFVTLNFRHIAIAVLAVLSLAFAGAADAATKKATVGPVSLEVPDDFKAIAGQIPSIRQDASGITIEVSELPPEALHEFKGTQFLEFLASLGYANAAYADGGLKRTDPHTYVLADAKGAEGPESRFLLVIGGEGRAAIVTAYALKSEISAGHASRAAIETILDTASMLPTAASKP